MRPPSLDAPQLALAGLTRIRWLAVIGQIGATAAAVWLLHIELPLKAIATIIAVTLTTNLFLVVKNMGDRVDPWLLPGVVLLDVALLTAILALTGGPANPFCTLYVVHVVLAVVLLGSFWTWVVVALSAAGFALLFAWHVDIEPGGRRLPAWARDAGAWMSLMLIAVLIAYYVGRIHRAFRQRDKQLSLMRERTERSARFAAVTALAAGAAHELGSPLGTIAVVAKELEIATAKAGTGEDIVEDARLIRTEVDRCRTILERMRLEVGDDLRYEAREMSAQEFIDGAVADLTDDRKPRVRTEVVAGAERFFLASRAVLRAAGVLLRNAFEASPPQATVLMRLRRNGDDLVVEVEDSGVGMPPEILKRAGEPFFTTKEMGRGMGMGLFLVKLVIENNDGRLELRSEPGRGTLARLILPTTPLHLDSVTP
jgi:two-component system, sensor histidine kinase RegB